jgi:hypothetical protein
MQMNTQTTDYRTKDFEGRNLAFFFLLAFGISWATAALIAVLGLDISTNGSGPVNPLVVLIGVTGTIGPSLAAFIVTGFSEGKAGIKALWKRFWNRNMSLVWLIVILSFYNAFRLIANLVARVVDQEAYPIVDPLHPDMDVHSGASRRVHLQWCGRGIWMARICPAAFPGTVERAYLQHRPGSHLDVLARPILFHPRAAPIPRGLLGMGSMAAHGILLSNMVFQQHQRKRAGGCPLPRHHECFVDYPTHEGLTLVLLCTAFRCGHFHCGHLWTKEFGQEIGRR